MKNVFLTLILFTAAANTSLAAGKELPKGTMFVDWDQRGKCWAFGQSEEALQKIDKQICRKEVGVIYAYNRLENFDVDSIEAHHNRTCYEFTPQGVPLRKMKDNSLCKEGPAQ